MALELPALPYAYDALGPYMSKETLEFHHDKHHMAYVTNGNNALKDSPLASKSVEEICKAAYAEKNAALINNVGQHYNHVHFWNWMKPNGGGKKIPARLQAAIDSDLGGYDKMRTDFIQAGVTQFGSRSRHDSHRFRSDGVVDGPSTCGHKFRTISPRQRVIGESGLASAGMHKASFC